MKTKPPTIPTAPKYGSAYSRYSQMIELEKRSQPPMEEVISTYGLHSSSPNASPPYCVSAILVSGSHQALILNVAGPPVEAHVPPSYLIYTPLIVSLSPVASFTVTVFSIVFASIDEAEEPE